MRSGTLNVPGIVGLGKAASSPWRSSTRRGPAAAPPARAPLRAAIAARVTDVRLNGAPLPEIGPDGALAPGEEERRLPGNLNLSFAGRRGRGPPPQHEGRRGLLGLGVHVRLARALARPDGDRRLAGRSRARLDPVRPRPLDDRGGSRLRGRGRRSRRFRAFGRSPRSPARRPVDRVGTARDPASPMLTDLVRGVPLLRGPPREGPAGRGPPVVAGGVGALPAAHRSRRSRGTSALRWRRRARTRRTPRSWIGDLGAAGLERVFHAPAPTLTPYQRIPPSLKSRRDEFSLLTALAGGGPPIGAVVSPARALFTRLPRPGALSEALPAALARARRSRCRGSSDG